MSGEWVVYILETRAGSLYTGVTKDLEARYRAHAAGTGARAVRLAGGPRRVLWHREGLTKADAFRLERAIKLLPRERKDQLVARGLAAVGLGPDGHPDG